MPAILSACLLLACLPVLAASEDDRPVEDAARFKLSRPANPQLPSLFLVGDSTVKCGTPGQRGWGEEFGKYFNLAAVNIVNHAIGGRSSRTFITEGRWVVQLLAGLPQSPWPPLLGVEGRGVVNRPPAD